MALTRETIAETILEEMGHLLNPSGAAQNAALRSADAILLSGRSEATITDASKATGAEGDRRDRPLPTPSQSGGLTELRAALEDLLRGAQAARETLTLIAKRRLQYGAIATQALSHSGNLGTVIDRARQALSSTPPAPNGEDAK